MNMLDHQKTVIENLKENKESFIKEVKKLIKWLDASEIRKLYIWLIDNFGSVYADTINFIFNNDPVVRVKLDIS